jgi:hypothetical protein
LATKNRLDGVKSLLKDSNNTNTNNEISKLTFDHRFTTVNSPKNESFTFLEQSPSNFEIGFNSRNQLLSFDPSKNVFSTLSGV